MSVFKAFFNIIRKNKMTFILALGINLVISFAYVNTLKSDTRSTFEAEKYQIAIIDNDDGALAKELTAYLKNNNQIIPIDSSNKSQQDALFFKKVLFIVTIPKGFSAEFMEGKEPTLLTKSVPNSMAEVQNSSLINQFLNQVSFYNKHYPEKNEKAVLSMVQENLSQEVVVSFDSAQQSTGKKPETAKIFNLLAYGLFMTILSSIGTVSISMNRPIIKTRNNCSPLSERKRSRYFYLAVAIFSLASWIIFVGSSLMLSGSALNSTMTQLMLLNSFVFLLAMISLGVTVSYFVTTTEMIAGLNNILVLGTCFISGAFVPQELLSEPVLKISSFFPTYWFITNNNLVANLETYNGETLSKFFFNLSVLLLFILVFALIGLILRKEQGGLIGKHRVQM